MHNPREYGLNHSDDLFMYARRAVPHLSPSTDYEVGFLVELATNAPSGCAGIGGAPGESVPIPAAIVLGDVATSSTSCTGGAPYALKTLDSGTRTLTARTDADGRLWVFVGVESGFEGFTRIYLRRLVISLDRVD